jgi:hypothetical protein
MRPREALLCLRVILQREPLHLAIPDHPAFVFFVDRDAFDPARLGTMKVALERALN